MISGQFLYGAFGLRLAFPAASQILEPVDDSGAPDVTVAYGDVRPVLAHPVAQLDVPEVRGRLAHNQHGDILWTTERFRCLVEGGDRVTLDVAPGSSASGGLHFVLYFGLPILLLQRGVLALHGNTVAGEAGAVTVLGESGAGKSTLATALLSAGYAMMSDDITALVLDAWEQVAVQPGFPLFKLCRDAYAQMAPPADRCWVIPDGRDKVLLRMPRERFVDAARPLRAVFVLDPPSESPLLVTPVIGAEKLQVLLEHTYLPALVQQRPQTFTVLPRLLQDIPMYRVCRPRDVWTVDELADKVIALAQTAL